MKPNVLLILIDSFNVNRIQGKNKTGKIPNIEKLIQKGAFFNQATSCADATLLSTTGLFTGKFPFKTGIRSPKINKLKNNVKTYFPIFKKNGYNLYALRPTLQENDDLFPNFDNNDNLYDVFQNLSEGLGTNILTKLESVKEPWFFFVHPHDLHQPIVVDDEFDHKEFGKNNYDKQLSAVDSWIGKICQKIDFSKTILILTADHGSYVKTSFSGEVPEIEADGKTQLTISKISNKLPKVLQPIKNRFFFFLEKQKQQKKEKIIAKKNLLPHEKRNLLSGRFTLDHTLFDDQIRIPLILVGAGINNQKILQQVRNIDILPTILDLVNFDEELEGDGISLKPLLDGKQMDESPVFLESNPMILKKSNDVIGVRTSKYKYFRDKNNPKKRVHLYNLELDPFEDKNISENSTEVVNEMESILENFVKGYTLE